MGRGGAHPGWTSGGIAREKWPAGRIAYGGGGTYPGTNLPSAARKEGLEERLPWGRDGLTRG